LKTPNNQIEELNFRAGGGKRQGGTRFKRKNLDARGRKKNDFLGPKVRKEGKIVVLRKD